MSLTASWLARPGQLSFRRLLSTVRSDRRRRSPYSQADPRAYLRRAYSALSILLHRVSHGTAEWDVPRPRCRNVRHSPKLPSRSCHRNCSAELEINAAKDNGQSMCLKSKCIYAITRIDWRDGQRKQCPASDSVKSSDETRMCMSIKPCESG